MDPNGERKTMDTQATHNENLDRKPDPLYASPWVALFGLLMREWKSPRTEQDDLYQ